MGILDVEFLGKNKGKMSVQVSGNSPGTGTWAWPCLPAVLAPHHTWPVSGSGVLWDIHGGHGEMPTVASSRPRFPQT